MIQIRRLLISLLLCCTSSSALKAATYEAQILDKMKSAIVRELNHGQSSRNRDGLVTQISQASAIHEPGSRSISISVSGIILNGFQEDIFLRNILEEDVTLSAVTLVLPSNKTLKLLGSSWGSGRRTDFIYLAGRQTTKLKDRIRDDGIALFGATKSFGIVPGTDNIEEILLDIQSGNAVISFDVRLPMVFHRMGSDAIQKSQLIMPFRVPIRISSKSSLENER